MNKFYVFSSELLDEPSEEDSTFQVSVYLSGAVDRHIAELESRLEITPDCQYDGIDTRDATIKNLESRLEQVKSERNDWIAAHEELYRELQECKSIIGNKCQSIAELEAQLAAERERCAAICDEIEERYQQSESRLWPELRTDAQSGSAECAAAIRNGESK